MEVERISSETYWPKILTCETIANLIDIIHEVALMNNEEWIS